MRVDLRLAPDIASSSLRGVGTGFGGVGKALGVGNGVGRPIGGSGSPTRLPFLGSSGLRRERVVEGKAAAARGRSAVRVLGSSKFGKFAAGGPVRGGKGVTRLSFPLCCCKTILEFLPLATVNGTTAEDRNKAKQTVQAMNRTNGAQR